MSNQRCKPAGNNDSPENAKLFSEVVIKYSNQVEDIIAWLFCKEEQLQQRPDEVALQETSFSQVLDEYSHHEKFMTEICEYCHTIMKCKEEGQELHDNDEKLTDEDRDEIGIQMDAMLVLYDKLKILTTDRLHNLQRIVDERQRSKIDRLEKWLTSMEIKLASSDNVGPDREALRRQMVEVEELKKELEQKQEFLNLVSRLIIFDDVDIGSSQIQSRSFENLESRLEEMNGRWTGICESVNQRFERLKKADAIWKLLHLEGKHLANWLCQKQERLTEISNEIENIVDPQTEKSFLTELMMRSEKIDSDIKSKQSFYTSLENRVRIEIENFDDPCSMFVIELEKKLEDMQDNWNTIMRQKRMIDYKLQALSNPGTIINDAVRPIIPVPDSITKRSNNDLKCNENCQTNFAFERDPLNQDTCNDIHNNSSSTGQDESTSSPQFNDSLSDAKAFENSSSSHDTKSLLFSHNNNLPQMASTQDNDSHDELSSATNLTYSHQSNIYQEQANNDSKYSLDLYNESKVNGKFTESGIENSVAHHVHDGNHSCRVEEWRHALESFSSWLRKVEISLSLVEPEAVFELNDSSKHSTWAQLDLLAQIDLIQEIESRISTSCQDEFDCLFLQGQQIIEDLMPEIGGSEYEANLRDILADIEVRYNSVKRCLLDHKREIADKERWRRLSKLLQNTCQHLITSMGEVIPESEIGVDLITLAQQQDQLMHLREEIDANTALQTCLKESKSFLKLHDILMQKYGSTQAQTYRSFNPTSSPLSQKQCNLVDVWLSFKEFRDDIENHHDRLTLHLSELSQIIDDRLGRLDEIHKEMHALQHCIQDLATKLQVLEILKSNWVPLDHLSIEQLSEQLEDLKIYRERSTEVEMVHKDMNNIVAWMERFGASLSPSNLNRVEDLNAIWNSIQNSVEERQKSIEQAFDEQSGSEQKFLAQTVSDLANWERRVATSKVPYFINHETEKTLWDHPKFSKILESMDECKQYVFSAYRTAMKLRILQKSLGIDKLMLEQLKEIFHQFDLILESSAIKVNANEGLGVSKTVRKNSRINVTSVGIEQIILLLKSIYEGIQASDSPSLDVPVAIDLTLNWLLNLYDATRTGHLSALSLKIGLTLICCATREEKYVYMFELISESDSKTVEAKKLGTLFEICTRIPTYLGESESFGGSDLIETSVRNCLAMSSFNPQYPNCIDLNDFLNWLKTEPQFIIWLPVFHRLLISENINHNQKCKLCGSNPIVGLRYRCLKCLKFNICQRCFLTGRHVYEHHDPLKHPLREYCCPSNMSDQVRDLTKIFRSAFT